MSNVIELKSRLYEIFLQQGEDHVENGHFRKAINRYTDAIELSPDDWRAYFRRGKVHSNSMDYGESISDFTTVIELKPDHTEAYTRRGITWDDSADVSQISKRLFVKEPHTPGLLSTFQAHITVWLVGDVGHELSSCVRQPLIFHHT